jgi:hypothetical protein
VRVNGWTANAISLGLDDSEIFRNCLSIGGKGNDRVATLRLVEHSGIIRTILDALLLPVNKLEAIPSYWTFEDAAADYAAAEKYMLDRYMSVFQRRIEKAVQIGPFEALIWAVSKSNARVAKLAIEQFAKASHLEIRAGSVRTEVKPGHWTAAMIESIGVENYRQLVRLSMDCITASIQTGRLRIDWLAVAEKFELHTGRPGIEWECLTPVSCASM